MIPPILKQDMYITLGMMISSSYQQLLGYPLLEKKQPNIEEIEALWNAPIAILSHSVEEDPIFNFGNRTALELFEMDFEKLIQLESRKSAEAVNRQKREQLLAEVTKNGFVTDYSGVRISATGKRFLIEGATIWNVSDSKGVYHGQAATFNKWTFL